MSAGPIIEVAELRKEFRTRRGPVTAVAGVNFQAAAGAFVGYAGPNGAGKSTTIKMMSGLLVPTSGRVVVDGLVPSLRPADTDLRYGTFRNRTGLDEESHTNTPALTTTSGLPTLRQVCVSSVLPDRPTAPPLGTAPGCAGTPPSPGAR